MTIPGFEFSEGAAVEMWSTRRLPYDPKNSDTRAARDRLRDILGRMAHDESKILVASYTSQPGGRPFDIENVLAYNLGTMRPFARTRQGGMCFERAWTVPRLSPSGQHFDHHHAYRLAPPPLKPVNGVTLTVELQARDLTDVARVWWAVSGATASGFASRGCRPIIGRFGLYVEIGMPRGKRLPSVIKKLLDGIIAGLQTDSEPNVEAVGRLAQYLRRSSSDVANRLLEPASPVLNKHDARLVRPYQKHVQWYPEDDRCDTIAVIATGSPGLCTVTGY